MKKKKGKKKRNHHGAQNLGKKKREEERVRQREGKNKSGRERGKLFALGKSNYMTFGL